MNEDKSVNRKSKSKRKKWSNRKKIVVSTISVFIAIIIFLLGGYIYVRNKIYSNTDVIKDSEYKEVPGITNVLLIGTDARTLDEQSRSDSIIIATLDNNNKKIKLTSLFRDTLVNIPGYGEQKINTAYALGGPSLLLETISDTYDIHIDKYVVINFWGFEAIIDQIGGIEVDVKDYQLEELNKYIGESTGGNDCPVTETGLQTLNGKQALSYARIRYNTGDEFERTSRQQEVLMKVAEKLRETKPSKYLGIMNKMLDYIKTNIDPLEALNMAYTIYKFPSLVTEQLQMPVPELAEGRLYKDLGWVFLMDGEQNAQILYDFIYEDKIPNADEYDYYSLYQKLAQYAADEDIYNSENGINPEDYENNDEELPKKEEIVQPPTEEKPSEQPSGGTDQPSGGTEQPSGGTDQPSGETDQPSGGTDQPSDGTDQPSDGTDQPSSGTDQPSDGTDQPSSGTDQPSGGTDQPSGGTDQPGGEADKPTSGTDTGESGNSSEQQPPTQQVEGA